MTRTAKLFRNGSSQAIRMPRDFRFGGDRVRVRRAGRGVLVERTLFDEDDAREAGRVRAELEGAGKRIGAYDVLIAGQGRRRSATLVTSNAREFGRVKGLKRENWALRRSSP